MLVSDREEDGLVDMGEWRAVSAREAERSRASGSAAKVGLLQSREDREWDAVSIVVAVVVVVVDSGGAVWAGLTRR